MYRLDTVVCTKIIPPRTGPHTLERARVAQILGDALNHRLTLVQAGAGFGKTTALAPLARMGRPLIWYQIMEEDPIRSSSSMVAPARWPGRRPRTPHTAARGG